MLLDGVFWIDVEWVFLDVFLKKWVYMVYLDFYALELHFFSEIMVFYDFIKDAIRWCILMFIYEF